MAFIYRFCSYCRRASHEHSFWNHSCKVLIIHLQSSSHLMTCEIPLIVCPDFCSSLWLCSHFEKQDTSLPIFTSPQQSCCLLTCHVSKNGSVGKCKVTMSQRGPAPCWSRLLFFFFFHSCVSPSEKVVWGGGGFESGSTTGITAGGYTNSIMNKGSKIETSWSNTAAQPCSWSSAWATWKI